MKFAARICIVAAVLCASAAAQSWQSLLPADRGIDWSRAGVGDIPPRPIACATLSPPASDREIDAALASCPANEAVVLAPGTYAVHVSVHIPSNVTLRGAGADQTILDAQGAGPAVVALGRGAVPFQPRVLVAGTQAGSTQLQFVSAQGIMPGTFLAIAEKNDPAFVTSAGSGGNCNWCDGDWSKDGHFARGQIVEVQAVSGNLVTFEPALYTSYSHEPVAVPFQMQATRAGVEDLQIKANNTGYIANFTMEECAYCWIKGVESNYADGDHVSVQWGFHDEIRDSYFSNSFLHGPGIHDSDIQMGWKTSASLVENNIIERTHVAVMLEWGAAGNVVAYNYTMGEFDSGAPNLDIGGVDFHGAHPQFNLLEGNVLTMIDADSVWGTSSDTTGFRNWVVGTNRICSPLSGRGPVDCSGTNGHYGFQAARAIEMSYLSTRNIFIGNVIGSAAMQSLRGYHYAVRQQRSIEYPAIRSYDGTAFGWSFGYGATGDVGTGTGCGGGTPPCHRAGTSATDFVHGNYDNIGESTIWVPGVTEVLPASVYLKGRPAWWGTMPFPATGPDVTGGPGPGGHSYGNPARSCYLKVMHGSDGGAGGPLEFNAERCYGTQSGTKAADHQ